ncbi:MAG: hypothetical protein JO115_02290 [Pseudonocardiales bacterium]|nr:hypothetical protein [Pseudonocardiales bacterium]
MNEQDVRAVAALVVAECLATVGLPLPLLVPEERDPRLWSLGQPVSQQHQRLQPETWCEQGGPR